MSKSPVVFRFDGARTHAAAQTLLGVEFLGEHAYLTFLDQEHGEPEQGPFTVPSGEVYVLGDNRNNSFFCTPCLFAGLKHATSNGAARHADPVIAFKDASTKAAVLVGAASVCVVLASIGRLLAESAFAALHCTSRSSLTERDEGGATGTQRAVKSCAAIRIGCTSCGPAHAQR